MMGRGLKSGYDGRSGCVRSAGFRWRDGFGMGLLRPVFVVALLFALASPQAWTQEVRDLSRAGQTIQPVSAGRGDGRVDTMRTSEEQVKENRLRTDLKRLDSLTNALQDMAEDMGQLQRDIAAGGRDYYTSDEHDLIEQLLFRFLMCRETLWDMIEFHRDYAKHFESDEQQTKSFIIGFTAGSHLYYYSSLFVYAFLDSPKAIGKLNEAYYRSEIPAGTYDMIFKSLTNPDNIKELRAAWQLYLGELNKSSSQLSKLARKDPVYRKLISGIGPVHDSAETRVEQIMVKRSLLLPEVRNALRHSEINQLVESTLRTTDNVLYAIRGLTFKNVSRLKTPTAQPIEFSSEQIPQMKEMLEPGDIILTYTSGYMSNLFLPGSFKHGITYVGSPEQRKSVGLEQLLEGKSGVQRKRFQKNLNTARLVDGSEADLIESVAEGVIFSSLHTIMTTHITRMVVWRPQLTPEQRISGLGNVFDFLGSDYDFKFDFSDATYQCCTEVVYRSLNRNGAIDFPLTRRMGTQTLSADDICLYAMMDEGDQAFTFVALACPDESAKGNRAKLLTGNEGLAKLGEIMGQ